MSRNLFFLFILLLVPQPLSAGFFDLSMFSRANCSVPLGGIPVIVGFNESITWDGTGASWMMYTKSHMHRCDSSECEYEYFLSDEEESTWRSYAGCMWCGLYGWMVDGEHYVNHLSGGWDNFELMDKCDFYGTGMASPALQIPLCKFTRATSCNLTEWKQ